MHVASCCPAQQQHLDPMLQQMHPLSGRQIDEATRAIIPDVCAWDEVLLSFQSCMLDGSPMRMRRNAARQQHGMNCT